MKKNKSFSVSLRMTIIPIVLVLSLTTDELLHDIRPKKKLREAVKIVPINPYLEEFSNDFEKHLTTEFAKSNVPGAAVAIVANGQVLFKKSLGIKSLNNLDSVNDSTAFRIASISKGFASVLTGIIVNNGQFTWEDPIKKHLAWFDPIYPEGENEEITIKNILSHSAGYPYQAYSNLIEKGMERDTMFLALQNVKLSRKPGEIHSYQNVAYSMIEPILESSLACNYQQMMEEMVFDKLKMNTASISYEAMVQNENKALPHLRSNNQYYSTPLSSSYYNVAAAGGINASINDMTEWMHALTGFQPDVIPPQVLDSVLSPVIQTRVRGSAFSRFDSPRRGYYGMGWRIVHYPSDTLIYHGGYANGYKSELALDREKDVAICILTNGPSNFPSHMVTEFFKILKFYEHDIKKWNKKMGNSSLIKDTPIR